MKWISKAFLLLLLFSTEDIYAAACTTISRTSSATNSILTSTKYNTDHNTAYTAINDIISVNCTISGTAITANTLPKAQLLQSDFVIPWDSFKDGCDLTYSSTTSVNIGPCKLSVSGSWISTQTTTNIAHNCSGCSASAATQVYYVYAKQSAAATGTLTPLISTTAPTDGRGYNSSMDKLLGRFWNNATPTIEQYSVQNWVGSRFKPRTDAGFFGRVQWTKTTNCVWSNGSTTFADFAPDADCDDNARTRQGFYNLSNIDAANSEGHSPQIRFQSMPAGVYTFKARGSFSHLSSAPYICAWRFTDGVNFTSPVMENNTTANLPTGTGMIEGEYIYTTDQTAASWRIQNAASANTCQIDGNVGATGGLEISVYYSPFTY